MSAPTDYFAQCERLARWAHVSLGAEGIALRDILDRWRRDNAIPLSGSALTIITAHVAIGQGDNHVGAHREEVACSSTT